MSAAVAILEKFEWTFHGGEEAIERKALKIASLDPQAPDFDWHRECRRLARWLRDYSRKT